MLLADDRWIVAFSWSEEDDAPKVSNKLAPHYFNSRLTNYYKAVVDSFSYSYRAGRLILILAHKLETRD